MTRKIKVLLISILSLISGVCRATVMSCPEPIVILQNWGVPPKPWEWNRFSESLVVRDSDQFYQADILVAGNQSLGVTCFYKSDDKIYSIVWQQIKADRDPYNSSNWHQAPSGYSCSGRIEDCKFNVGN